MIMDLAETLMTLVLAVGIALVLSRMTMGYAPFPPETTYLKPPRDVLGPFPPHPNTTGPFPPETTYLTPPRDVLAPSPPQPNTTGLFPPETTYLTPPRPPRPMMGPSPRPPRRTRGPSSSPARPMKYVNV